MLVSVLKNIYKKINGSAVHGSNNEKMPYDEQMKYLNNFPNPKDDFERSFFKYKCFCKYCYYKRRWLLILFNIGAMFLLPFVYRKLKRVSSNQSLIEKVDAVIENIPRLPNTDVIPEEIQEKYSSVKEITNLDYSKSLLTNEGEDIYKKVRKKYFFRFYFRMIVLQKLGQFSYYLKSFQPKMIVFYSCEREFSGPLQTLLCENSGAEYISFMHGDYLSTLSFAFQKYSKYYIWDTSYEKMFKELKCDFPMQIYKPKKLRGIAEKIDDEKCDYFATYYFSDESKAEAVKIKEVFAGFEKLGLKTKIRPHPRFSDLDMLNQVFNGIEIEDTKNCSLSDSITMSLFTVGLNTTVLSEAYFSDKQVVIDDISNKGKYNELYNRGYIMIQRPHILLSDLRDESYHYSYEEYAFVSKEEKSSM